MPPKRTGKGRKKAKSVDVVKNGSEVEEVKLQAIEKAGRKQGQAQVTNDENGHAEEPEDASLTDGSVGNAKEDTLPELDEIPPKKTKVGRNAKQGADQDSGDSNEEAHVPDTKDVAPKKARGGKNVKQGAVQEIGDSNEEAQVEEQVSETKDIPPKKGRGERTAKQRAVTESGNSNEGEEPVPETKDVDSKEEEQEPKSKDVAPKKTTGGGRKGKRGADQESVDSNEEVQVEEQEPKSKVVAPKRGRGGRNAKQVVVQESGDSNEEKQEPKSKVMAAKKARNAKQVVPESGDSNEEEQMPETKDISPRKTRGGRNAKEAEPISETKDVPPGKAETNKAGPRSRGRKQAKDAEKDTKDGQKPGSALETRVLKVSLLRQKNVDAMAMEELNRAGGEVKVAGGSSKARGKRARKEDGGGGPAKATKTSSASSPIPRKGKILDVEALDFDNTSTTKSGEPWNLKIVSWNVNGIRAWLEKDGISYLHHESPDVMCIQETKCSEDKIPEVANVEGYHCYWLAGDKDGYSGVGMLSKRKPLSVEYGIGLEEHDAEGRVVTADFDKFYLVAAYVPNAGRGLVRLEYRKKWDSVFRAYLKTLDSTKPVVLCGDLNVAHQEIDLANPKSNKRNAGFTQEERDGFSSLLEEGFVDAYRSLYPSETGAYTFWTYMMNARAKNVGWRIDYFVVSERFADRVCDCRIRSAVMGSDHCPLVLFLCV